LASTFDGRIGIVDDARGAGSSGHGRHWLGLRLVGTRSNRAVIGAKLRVDAKDRDGKICSIFREVGAGLSYGGNSFVQHIGLAEAERAATVEITRPITGIRQVFHQVAADRTIEVIESAGSDETPAPAPPRSGRTSAAGDRVP
jgi:hypothetical protein